MRIIPIYAAVLGQDHHDRGIPLHCLSGALHGLDSGHGVKLPAIAISDGKQHIGMTRSAGFTPANQIPAFKFPVNIIGRERKRSSDQVSDKGSWLLLLYDGQF